MSGWLVVMHTYTVTVPILISYSEAAGTACSVGGYFLGHPVAHWQFHHF